MQNFNVLNLWPNCMSYSNYENDISPIRDLVIKENSLNEQTKDRITTIKGTQINPQVQPWNWDYPEWVPVKQFVEASINKYIETVYNHIDIVKPTVVRSWSVAYDEGGYQEPHCHPQVDLSGLLVLQQSTKGGDIVFTNPALQSSYTNFQPYSHNFRPQAGDLLIWPAWILHYTLPTEGPLNKVVISFDISLYR